MPNFRIKFHLFILLFQFFCLSFNSAAQVTEISTRELKNGDVVLVSLRCYVCSLIEAEAGLPFSHSGLIIFNQTENQWFVMEALGPVNMVPLTTFFNRRREGTNLKVLRNKDLAKHFAGSPSNYQEFTINLKQKFDKEYIGLNFDSEFLWDNQDQLGEKLYCSEFVAKILNEFLGHKIEPVLMKFEVNRILWEKYFKGKIPENKLGLSPADFYKSSWFFQVGDLVRL